MQRNKIIVEEYHLNEATEQIIITLIGGETKVCKIRDYQSWLFNAGTPEWANDLKAIMYTLNFLPSVSRLDLASFLEETEIKGRPCQPCTELIPGTAPYSAMMNDLYSYFRGY